MKYDMAPTLNAEKIDDMPEIKAIYLTLFNYAAIENVDLFGPLTYYDNKGNFEGSSFEYDRVKDIYYQVKADIDAAIESSNITKTTALSLQKTNWKNYRKSRAVALFRLFIQC